MLLSLFFVGNEDPELASTKAINAMIFIVAVWFVVTSVIAALSKWELMLHSIFIASCLGLFASFKYFERVKRKVNAAEGS